MYNRRTGAVGFTASVQKRADRTPTKEPRPSGYFPAISRASSSKDTKESSASSVWVCNTKAPRLAIARDDFCAAVSSGHSTMLSRQASPSKTY